METVCEKADPQRCRLSLLDKTSTSAQSSLQHKVSKYTQLSMLLNTTDLDVGFLSSPAAMLENHFVQ